MAAPVGGLNPSLPGTYVPTPGSEKSVYYDADFDGGNSDMPMGTMGGNEGADVTRKPSVAVGALEPREPAGGGILANKRGGEYYDGKATDNVKFANVDEGKFRDDNGMNDVRDSGYAQASSPVGESRERQRSGSRFVEVPSSKEEQGQHGKEQSHEASPAYEDRGGNVFIANDTKGPVRYNDGTTSSATDEKRSSQFQSGDNFQSNPNSTQGVIAPPPRASERYDAQDRTETASPDGTVGSTGERHHRQETSGTFAHGAALTGPDAIPDENIAQDQRTVAADGLISEQAKKKIGKDEKKDAKRLIKIIKSEGSSQKTNLSTHLSELSRLQRIQKQASKDEISALHSYNSSSARAHNKQTKYLQAKAKYEETDAEAKARKEALGEARRTAEEVSKELGEKTREVEMLRQKKMVDDREREVRIEHLSGIGEKQK